MNVEGLEIRALDEHFGRALRRWSDDGLDAAACTLLERLGVRLSAELGRQNGCLALSALAREEGWPGVDAMAAVLERSGLLAAPDAPGPLVLDGDELYLARMHDYETALARTLTARAAGTLLAEEALDELAPRLAALFPGDEVPDWQRVAAATALDRRLAVIAGGPGTGKTTTVARLLALLVEQAGAGPTLRIRLAAPTGKAAARLTESLRDARAALEAAGVASAVSDALPDSASTLHRLLGYRVRENTFRYGPDAPLAADVVVVDEASMVDLRLMACLVSALPEDARLVLLGDPDQLSSVEAGRVLGDLCAWTEARGDGDRFTPDGAARLSRLVGSDLGALAGASVPALADALCLLRRSHRFDAGGALGRFARAVNEGDADAAVALVEAGEAGLGVVTGTAALLDTAVEGYVDAVEAAAAGGDAAAVLGAFARFQVLCASRHGPLGVERVNVSIEQGLRQRGLVRGGETHYAGRPVMVTVNDYGLGLFNGDVGVILRGDDGVARACFLATDRTVRTVRASRLPAHETAFAITVHKSQGSEFDRVLVILGDDEPRLLTRELLYTAVTRARSEAVLCASPDALRRAVATRSERRSGLRRRLWPDLNS